ncbi:hypothetical protein K435DRAFT_872938 [Dendrothele bispora CBS 962.96]|uniref:Uncharacterized protein n=1 Tax=Dendrothele bispora (strain CBS 962.96) TaxID=1314807 RepID=A0A4S8L096_DENBC|nr:hypothetical protein K435DRAFT_872938 [Dendrothele bispora CBS 962.96]
MAQSVPPASILNLDDLDALHNGDGWEYPDAEQDALRSFLRFPNLLQAFKEAGLAYNSTERRQSLLDIVMAEVIKAIGDDRLPSSIPSERSHLGPRLLEMLYELTESPVTSPTPMPPPAPSSSTQPGPTLPTPSHLEPAPPTAPDSKQWNSRRVAQTLNADRYTFYHVQHQDKPWHEIHNCAMADLIQELGPEKMKEYASLADRWRIEGPPEEYRDDPGAAMKKANALFVRFLQSMKQRFGLNVYALVNWAQADRPDIHDIAVKTTPGWLEAAELGNYHRRIIAVHREMLAVNTGLQASGTASKKTHPAWTQVQCGPSDSYPLLFELPPNPSKSDMFELIKNFMHAVATAQGGLNTRRGLVPWNALAHKPNGPVINDASVPAHLRSKVGPLDKMKLQELVQWWEHLLDRQRRNEVPVTFQSGYLKNGGKAVSVPSTMANSGPSTRVEHGPSLPSANSSHASNPGASSPSPPPLSPLPPTAQAAGFAAVGLESENGSLLTPQAPGFLHTLEQNLARIPETIPVAAPSDIFAQFVNPESCAPYGTSGDDLWEAGLNQHMHNAFWGRSSAEDMVGLLRRGPLGVRAYLGFVRYFVEQRGVSPNLFKERTELLNQAIELTCKRDSSKLAIDPTLQALSATSTAAMSSAAPTLEDELRTLRAAFQNTNDDAMIEDFEFDSTRTFLGTKRKSGPPCHGREDKSPRLTQYPPSDGVGANTTPSETPATAGSYVPAASAPAVAVAAPALPSPQAPEPSPSQPLAVPDGDSSHGSSANRSSSSRGRNNRGRGQKTKSHAPHPPVPRQTRSKAAPSSSTSQPERRSICTGWDLTGHVQHVLLECGGDEEFAKLVYPPAQDRFRAIVTNIYRFVGKVDRPKADISLAQFPELPSVLTEWVQSVNDVWNGVESQPMQVTDELLHNDQTLLSLQGFAMSILLRSFDDMTAEDVLRIRWFQPNGQGLEHLLWAIFVWGRALALSEGKPSKKYRWEEYQTVLQNMQTATDILRKASKNRTAVTRLFESAFGSIQLLPSAAPSG